MSMLDPDIIKQWINSCIESVLHMTSTGQRIILGGHGTIIHDVLKHTEIIPYIADAFSSNDLYKAFQQLQAATHGLKPSTTADLPNSMVWQVDIITPGYRVGAVHVLDIVSSVTSRSFNHAIYEFSALAVTETQCTTTNADDNSDDAAPDPSVLLVATLQCQMQDFESRIRHQEALRSQMVVEM